jgi:hypothetical protein
MTRKSTRIQNPVSRWNVRYAGKILLENEKIGALFDLAVREGMDPGDYVMHQNTTVAYLRDQGYVVQYLQTGETEDIDLDVLE